MIPIDWMNPDYWTRSMRVQRNIDRYQRKNYKRSKGWGNMSNFMMVLTKAHDSGKGLIGLVKVGKSLKPI